MDQPRIYVDFNELLEHDLVLLSQTDTKRDSSGQLITLYEGKQIHIYMDDVDENGNEDHLIADGVVVPNPGGGWSTIAIWCCRIDEKGIRHESDEKKK